MPILYRTYYKFYIHASKIVFGIIQNAAFITEEDEIEKYTFPVLLQPKFNYPTFFLY